MSQIHDQFPDQRLRAHGTDEGVHPRLPPAGSGVIVNIPSISATRATPTPPSTRRLEGRCRRFHTDGLNVELADFGVSAKAIFPGAHATRIFTKIDQAADVPEAYLPGIQRFFRHAGGGSKPAVTAQAIYEAVTDGKDNKVRYYTGPDGTAIPRVKQLLGADWYWDEFRKPPTATPSDLWKSLIPRAPSRSSSTSDAASRPVWASTTTGGTAPRKPPDLLMARVDQSAAGRSSGPRTRVEPAGPDHGPEVRGSTPRRRHRTRGAAVTGLRLRSISHPASMGRGSPRRARTRSRPRRGRGPGSSRPRRRGTARADRGRRAGRQASPGPPHAPQGVARVGGGGRVPLGPVRAQAGGPARGDHSPSFPDAVVADQPPRRASSSTRRCSPPPAVTYPCGHRSQCGSSMPSG